MTSSIVRALGAELAAAGHDLIVAGRDAREVGAIAADLRIRYHISVRPWIFDVLDMDVDRAVLESVLAETGLRLTGVVVGVGTMGDHEEAKSRFCEARRILDTNFTACVALLTPIANHLEAQGEGFICVISSVAGERGRQSNYLYGSAKAGLTAYLQGLRNRLYPTGVHVVTVLPGFVDTAITYGMPGLFLVASPERLARGIHRAILRQRDVVYLPWFWRWIMLVIRSVPERIFKRLRL